ncbi:alpha,alpha-trehalase [Spizellomyces sp. 'palustris']|nr:alpha,alpha-trehalase [Spizellomyces sp. 'palustris']
MSRIGMVLMVMAAWVMVSAQNPGCDSPIYCPGPLLDAVQRAKIYKDSKTFVDKPTTKPLTQVLSAFNALGPTPSASAIKIFVDQNFGPEGTETEQVVPRDWKPSPAFLSSIKDGNLREWGQIVHSYWKNLTRDFKTQTVNCTECVSSLLPAKHTFVVPGGRFREFYYWDSYFVMEGLILSEMFETSHDIIENQMDFVEKYGFVPNGARIYYLNRSQPPMLTQMVDLYITAKKNTSSLARWLPLLDKEYQFWQKNRTVTVKGQDGKDYLLNRFDVINQQPRPESWNEDLVTVEGGNITGDAAKALYADLATAAESGWDFSSRWENNPTNNSDAQANLRRLVTRQIIPVDLNSLLYANEQSLQKLHTMAGNRDQAMLYKRESTKRRLGMWEVFWDDREGNFMDFNMTSGTRSIVQTPAGYWPLWSGVALEDPRGKPTDRCTDLMRPFSDLDSILKRFPGGIPTTFFNTGLQWDLPNSWPPLAFMTMRALQRTITALPSQNCTTNSVDSLKTTLQSAAQQYITSAFCSWRETGGRLANLPPTNTSTKDDGNMFEKFDATKVGGAGSGGEYEVQDGFGWTNGVAIWTLREFGDVLNAGSCAFEQTQGQTDNKQASAGRRRVGVPRWAVMLKGLMQAVGL